jgi:hypothetical protein
MSASDRGKAHYAVKARDVRRRTGALLALLSLASGAALAAPKTDVLVFRNGDRLTGEIKGLDRGKLSFDTDATGTIGIEWEDVASLVTGQRLQVETQAGALHLGTLVVADDPGSIQVDEDDGTTTLPMASVVRMTPIEGEWLDQLDGDVSAGYSLVSANDQTQFNFELNLEYQTEKLLTVLNADATTTNSSNNPETQRGTVSLQTYRLLPERWFTGAVALAERNDELGIERRWSVGWGGGRFVKQSNSQIWRATGGIIYTHELLLDSDESEGSFEGLLALDFDWFHFDEPELDLSTNLTLYPSLTESGRWRSSYAVSLKWEIISDFFWRLSLIGDYDNKPRDPNANENDYTLNTSLGWDF